MADTRTPPTPPITLDDVKAAVRQVLAEIEAETAPVDPGPPVLTRKTIRHNVFSYEMPGGGTTVAMRGDTVELLPHDVERGEEFDAFTLRVGVMPEPTGSYLPEYPLDGDAAEVEQDAWVKGGTVEEIIAAVNARPEIAGSVIAAEQRRGEAARKTLLTSLGMQAASAA